jgi:Ca2+-binding EF-hand superfamily protein
MDQKEILHIITATSELLGRACDAQTAKIFAKKILDACDKKRNGKVTREEFING